MEFRTEENVARVRAADEAERQLALETLRTLARPRLVGTVGASAVEAELRGRFEALGYEIEPLPFRFSTVPGRYGVAAMGVLAAASSAAASVWLVLREPVSALLILGGAAGFAGLSGLFADRLIASFPLGRHRTANWLVRRPGARPRYVIVAHRDSKSQAISTYLRTAAIALAAVSWVALATLAAVGLLSVAWIWPPLVVSVGVLGVAGGGLLAASPAGNESPGALDNATGLAALIGVAEREREHDDVAFLVTDGEELGLAGARDAARRLPPVDGIIDLDGLDDAGPFHIVERFGWPRRRGLAPHLAAALYAAASALDEPADRRDLPPGILVDHIPFGRAGFPAVSLLRGTARSLRRVHRPEDSPDVLTGRGVALSIAIVSGALALLRARRGAA